MLREDSTILGHAEIWTVSICIVFIASFSQGATKYWNVSVDVLLLNDYEQIFSLPYEWVCDRESEQTLGSILTNIFADKILGGNLGQIRHWAKSL